MESALRGLATSPSRRCVAVMTVTTIRPGPSSLRAASSGGALPVVTWPPALRTSSRLKRARASPAALRNAFSASDGARQPRS